VIGYSLPEIGKFMVTILAFHGSPRYNGNTSSLLEQAVMGARDEGAIVEEIDIK
jgi:multimeric flavodoxin WrbA